MSKVIAGVDIGGSGTKACIVAEDGRILARTALPTDLAHSEGVGDLAVAALSKAAADAGYGFDQVESVGVGIPGQVSDGYVRYAANLGIGEAGLDLGGYVSSATQVPTLVDNDMTVAAYGAYVLTAAGGETVRNLVYVGIGTGVSAGVILDGEVYRGSLGLAGEFGHVPMGTGIECACGSTGCLETVIGSNGLSEGWDGAPVSSLFRSASTGDARAAEMVGRAIEHLALAMWWLASTYDPDLFYLGGGVGAGAPSIRDMVVARWEGMAGKSGLARRVLDPDRIRLYDLEDPVGAYGAALLGAGQPGRSGKRREKRSGRRNQSHE